MEAIRNCFGGKRTTLTEEDDRDPLLPKHAHPNSHHFQTARDSPEPTPSRVVNAGAKGKARRIIDFAERSDSDVASPAGPRAEDEKTLLDKLVDASAAISSGKLPSQDQVSQMLQMLLHSDFLNLVQEPEADSRASFLHGTGPGSRRGRKLLTDTRNLLQALLQFGMEKNDDNKLQDLLYNLSLLDTPGSGDSFNQPNAHIDIPNVDVRPHFDLNQATDASLDAIGASARAAEAVKDQIPTTQEIKTDGQVLVHALRTIFTSLLSSYAFRFLLADLLSILRQVAAKGAKDVAEVAAEVQQAAESVEERMEMNSNPTVSMGRDKGKQREGEEGKTYAELVEGIDQAVKTTVSVAYGDEKDLKGVVEGAREALGEVVSGAVDTAALAVKEAGGKAEEWKRVERQAVEEAEEDLRERLQQVLVQAQEDPASRNAFRAILILVRKYADRIGEATETVIEAAERVGEDVYSQQGISGSATVNVNVSGSSASEESREEIKPTYPPPSSLYPSTISGLPGSSAHGKYGGTGNDSPAIRAVEDAKIILERSARGTSLDGLLSALGRLVRDVNGAPSQLGKAVDDGVGGIEGGVDIGLGDVTFRRGGAVMNQASKAKGLAESESTASIDTIRPVTPSENKATTEKRKGRRRRQKQGSSTEQETPVDTPIQVPEAQGSATDHDRNGESQPNAIQAFFRHLGLYLDRAMDEPGYVTSRRGKAELEGLWGEGVALVSVVEAIAEDISHGVVEGASGSEEGLGNRRAHLEIKASGNGAKKVAEAKEKVGDRSAELKEKFRADVRDVVGEVEKVVRAMESDKSTTKLLHALGSFSASLSELFGEPSQAVMKSKKGTIGVLKRAVWTSVQRTEWLGWALPKILKLIPVNTIPLPSLEAKSESGGWEAGLYALFVRGNALQRQRLQGSRYWQEYASDRTPTGGLETTLIPDRVAVTEWAEVVVDMPDERTGGPTSSGASTATTQQYASTAMSIPRVETTSRVRVQLDGMRAKLGGLGYFFKYGGRWLGYEDEGIVSVDAGMSKKYSGLGCVVEVEFQGERGRIDSLGLPRRRDGASGRVSPEPSPAFPPSEGIIGEGLEGEGELVDVPGMSVVEETNEMVANDIAQDSLVSKGQTCEDKRALKELQTELEELERAGLEPLFRVANVRVEMNDVKLELEKSRHWILNKLLVQPLAGRTVAQVVKRLLQEQLKDKLEDLALGLARVKLEAELNGSRRRERQRAERMGERRERVARMVRAGKWDESEIDRLYDLEGDDDEGSGPGCIQDWANAIVRQGSRIMESRKARPEREHREEETRTRSEFDLNKRGVVYHQETVVDQYPAGSPSALPQQTVMFNERTGRMQAVEETVREEGGGYTQSESEGMIVESDLTVAVGGGAQLFGNKAVPYGSRNDQGDFVTEGSKLVDSVKDTALDAAGEAIGVTAHVGSRWNAKRREEECQSKGWESELFNF